MRRVRRGWGGGDTGSTGYGSSNQRFTSEQQQICAGRQDLGGGRWAVTSARRAQLGSDPGPSRLFPAPALALSPPAEELTSLGCCGSGGGEEAVHDEDGRRRVREEASDLGKEGRSRVRKWCNGGRRRWRKADAATAPARARRRRRPVRVEGQRE